MPRLVLPRATLRAAGTLAEAARWTDETARALGADGAVLDRIVIATGEAVANAARYGSGDVTVELDRSPAGWTVAVGDGGPGPGRERIAAARLPADPLATGGRGLFLLGALADRVDADGGRVRLLFTDVPA